MGRKTEFEKAANRDERLNRNTIISEMLNKADIGTDEMAEVIGITDRSVRDILNKLCDKYKELNIQDFKLGKSYKFKAAWNGLLTTLLVVTNLPQYDKRKNQYSLEGHLDHLEELIKAIDENLNEIDQGIVKTHSTYQQAELELKLYDSLLHRIGRITNQVGMMPPSLRFQTLAGINQVLEHVPSHIAHKHSSYLIENHLYKKHTKETNEINETAFQEDLEEYLVTLLSLRLQGQKGIEETHNIEVVGSTLLEQLVLGNLSGIEAEGIDALVTKTRDDLLEQPKIKETLQKVSAVLDQENKVDQLVLHWIEELLLILATTAGNKNGNKEIGKELVRQVVTEEVYRHLNEFIKSDDEESPS